ncbi:MAG: chorismate lyase [Methylovulum sp.]|nr:chorismate lyase [Methylovulum sp.]
MATKSLLFDQEPVWHENRLGTRHKLPAAVQSWAYESGSLTQRLRNIYGRSVAVSVLLQQWRTPFLSEQKLLKQPAARYCLIREVMLHADGKPLILARTIIPAETIKVAHSNLSQLGTRPLGEVIFSYPKLERVEMDVALVKPCLWTSATFEKISINQPIWGRRTVYGIRHKHMLVSEFFLPEVLHWGG